MSLLLVLAAPGTNVIKLIRDILWFLLPFTDLLIDISDVLQICCYELGRTYLKLSQALCINIPSIGESLTEKADWQRLCMLLPFFYYYSTASYGMQLVWV